MSIRTAIVLVALFVCGCGKSASERVVVYCAHDREFAEGVLAEFGRRTGLEVVPRFDTEANKAVGLYEDLVREASRPRCDVHWNNEILATIRLQEQGIYQAYESPSAAPFPARHKAADHTWTAFAARARVLIVNTNLVKKEERPRGIEELTLPRWRDCLVMAKPQFGTTATQTACLYQAWGDARTSEFFRKLHENNIRILPGNKQVAVAVGRGQFVVGLTDTDDAVAEVEAGNPVTIVFPDADAAAGSRLGTLFIPNTVAVIKNCPNPDGARRLVDYLLSPEVEERLAKSESRQIPLNPEVRGDLPALIEEARKARPFEVDFAEAARNWDKAQKTVREILSTSAINLSLMPKG